VIATLSRWPDTFTEIVAIPAFLPMTRALVKSTHSTVATCLSLLCQWTSSMY